MHTKLTVSVDKEVAEKAEIYAKSTKKSVSQLVENYLLLISTEPVKNEDISNRPLGPITKQLAGIIETNDNSNYKELLTDALTEKYL